MTCFNVAHPNVVTVGNEFNKLCFGAHPLSFWVVARVCLVREERAIGVAMRRQDGANVFPALDGIGDLHDSVLYEWG